MTGRTIMQGSPASNGFRMPAEWERHAATWIAWPHNRGDWPGKIAPVQWVYGEIARKVTLGENLRILVNTSASEKQARRILTRVGVDPGKVEFFRIPTNRGWTRDTGPIHLRREHRGRRELAIAGFKFNAWAKYPDWDLDCRVPARIAAATRRTFFPVLFNKKPVVLEGGSIDVNGRGSLITTEECLLDGKIQARNPGLDKEDLGLILAENLGARNVLWLGKGIAGDDTHGHVDDLCRFVRPGTLVLCRESNPQDANYRALEENRERAEGFRLEDGGRAELAFVPMPAPLYLQGQRLPASYANFYITNQAVLVPTFNDPNDRLALGILADLFSDRAVVGIHAVDLVWGLGTLHCLTQQEPAVDPPGKG
jgi:agmatine deiminase